MECYPEGLGFKFKSFEKKGRKINRRLSDKALRNTAKLI